ncbi:MAG: SDR family oxidoreductase [Bacteroidia bacterium]|nr:SDR family oxidoreductase [Bacteroidia bacterium]
MKTALVTGASKGMGLEWCRQLGQNGYLVFLSARSQDQAETAAARLRQEGIDCIGIVLDSGNEESILLAAEIIQEHCMALDLLVNNAGINPKDYPDKEKMASCFKLESLNADAVLEVMKVNSLGPLLVVKHMLPLLKNSPEPKVLQISSWLGSVSQVQFGGHYGYAGSKNLLNMLNKLMANELKQDGIISVCVNPGWVQTDMGGSKANFTIQEAVSNMLSLVSILKPEDSGKFLNYDGEIHPW